MVLDLSFAELTMRGGIATQLGVSFLPDSDVAASRTSSVNAQDAHAQLPRNTKGEISRTRRKDHLLDAKVTGELELAPLGFLELGRDGEVDVDVHGLLSDQALADLSLLVRSERLGVETPGLRPVYGPSDATVCSRVKLGTVRSPTRAFIGGVVGEGVERGRFLGDGSLPLVCKVVLKSS